ncbi:MAG: hypothetical protein IJ594_08690 [Oscillospiraceae bacterium]|nr:hypothetical protein [Oscillospiraceae bacterium]
MKLTIVIPVTDDTGDLGKKEMELVRGRLLPDTELEAVTIGKGFPAIESELHAVFNAPSVVLAAQAAYERGSDGIFVDCFDDPGVFACRELLPIPVLGGYRPALGTAQLLAERYAVITTDRAGIQSEERKARAHGFHPAVIRAVDMEVLELRDDQDELLRRLTAACLDLWETERCTAAVLGCTGMCGVAERLGQALREAGAPMTVVEPYCTGLLQLESLVRLGYRNHVPGPALALDGLDWHER